VEFLDSSNHDEFLPGIGRQGTQAFLSSVFQNQSNHLTKVRQTFFTRLALAISRGHFGAVSDIPRTALLDYCSELVAQVDIFPPSFTAAAPTFFLISSIAC
jgi:hypothetical protein